MILQRVIRDSRREIARHSHRLPALPFHRAAQAILAAPPSTLILTGFYIPEACTAETDGLSGSVLLAQSLTRLGKHVTIMTDRHALNYLQKLAEFLQLHLPVEVFSSGTPGTPPNHRPETVIAVERPGPGPGGRFLTCRGIDITIQASGPEIFMLQENCLTIGIGDGGNELGMGRLAENLSPELPRCTIAADCTLTGATSDWAAFGLVAALQIISGQPLLPPDNVPHGMLKLLSSLGAVDGMTGKTDPTVDGFSAEDSGAVIADLRKIAVNSTPYQKIIDLFMAGQHKKYGVAVGNPAAEWQPENRSILIHGSLLLASQRSQLHKELLNFHGSSFFPITQ